MPLVEGVGKNVRTWRRPVRMSSSVTGTRSIREAMTERTPPALRYWLTPASAGSGRSSKSVAP